MAEPSAPPSVWAFLTLVAFRWRRRFARRRMPVARWSSRAPTLPAPKHFATSPQQLRLGSRFRAFASCLSSTFGRRFGGFRLQLLANFLDVRSDVSLVQAGLGLQQPLSSDPGHEA